ARGSCAARAARRSRGRANASSRAAGPASPRPSRASHPSRRALPLRPAARNALAVDVRDARDDAVRLERGADAEPRVIVADAADRDDRDAAEYREPDVVDHLPRVLLED